MERTRPDYRRETAEILKNKNISSGIVMSHIGISHNTFYRWKRGDTSPTTHQFEQLKALAEGKVETVPDQKTEGSKVNNDVLKMAVELGALRERCKHLEAENETLRKKAKSLTS